MFGCTDLDLSRCLTLEDIAPLGPVTGLTRLDISRCTKVRGLAPLAELVNLVDVSLANCSATAAQTVVLQGGAYGEHALTAVQAEGSDAVPISDADGLGNSAFAVRKPPNFLRAAEETFCASCEPVAVFCL